MLTKKISQAKFIPKLITKQTPSYVSSIKNYRDYTEKKQKTTCSSNTVDRVLINTTVKGEFVNEAVKSEF